MRIFFQNLKTVTFAHFLMPPSCKISETPDDCFREKIKCAGFGSKNESLLPFWKSKKDFFWISKENLFWISKMGAMSVSNCTWCRVCHQVQFQTNLMNRYREKFKNNFGPKNVPFTILGII